MGQNINASVHLYADDTIIYCCASTVALVFEHLRSAFDIIQTQLLNLRLVLNADKTKVMLFSGKKKVPEVLPGITTAQGTPIELVASYKYLGITIDDGLCFKTHIKNLLKKLKLKLGFFFRNKSCFSFNARKRLVAATFLPVLDYGDIVYMNAPTHSLKLLDAAYHGALRFITDCKPLTHHCTLYSLVNWSSLSTRRLLHWYHFIYKSILGLLPTYLSSFMSRKHFSHSLRSQDCITFTVPSVRTELGKTAFSYSAPSTWNSLQQSLKLSHLIPLEDFKYLLNTMETSSFRTCLCS